MKMDASNEKVKSNTSDYNYSNVRCTMYIQMRWLDRPGWRNSIEWLSGNTKIDKGTIKSGKVSWGVYSNDIHGSQWLKNPRYFSFDPDYDYNDWGPGTIVVGGGVYAEYEVTFKENSEYIYIVRVSPTIID